MNITEEQIKKSKNLDELKSLLFKLPGNHLSVFRGYIKKCYEFYSSNQQEATMVINTATNLMHQRQNDSLIQNLRKFSISSTLLVIFVSFIPIFQIATELKVFENPCYTVLFLLFLICWSFGLYYFVNHLTEKIRRQKF